MNRIHRTTWLPALLAAFALIVVHPGLASAHAKLKSSVPAAGSTVKVAPATVSVVFDNHDPINPTSVLRVTDATGAQVDMGDTALDKSDADRKTVVVSLKSGLPNGEYTVNWTAKWTSASESGEGTEEGSFKFSVSSSAPAAPAAPQQLPQTGAGDSLPAALVPAAGLLIGLGLTLRARLRRATGR
jgi:methionine-rich copper-binding protein CopC